MAAARATVSDTKQRLLRRNIKHQSSYDDDQTLASKIQTWATEEMNFQLTGINASKQAPSVDQLNNLTRGKMGDIWKFITSQVKSLETAKKIRGNVILRNSGKSNDPKTETKDALKKEKHQLLQTLCEIQAMTSHTDKNNQVLQEKVADCDKVVKSKEMQLRQIEREILILDWICQMISNRINTYCKKIEKVQLIIKETSNIREIEKKLPLVQEIEPELSTKVENACKERVKKLCDYIENCLHKLMKKGDMEKVEMAFLNKETKDDELRKEALELISTYPIQLIIKSLTSLSAQSIAALMNDIKAVDIKKDAETLKFQYEASTGNLVDLAKPQQILQSVSEILQTSKLEHIALEMKTEKIRNDVIELENKYLRILDEVHKSIKASFPDCKEATIVKGAVEEAIELASMNASLNFLTNVQYELNIEQEESFKRYQEKEEKLKEIRRLREFKEKKQKLIRTLIGENVGIHQWMNNTKHLISQYVKTELSADIPRIVKSVEPLWDTIPRQLNELHALSKAHISLLLENQHAAFPSATNIAIYALDFLPNATNQISSLFDSIFTAEKSLQYKNLEQLLEFALKTRLLKSSLKCPSQTNDKFLLPEINVLIDQVSIEDKKQTEIVIPKLDQSLDAASKSLELCDVVTQDLHCWWNQPAKNIPSTLTVKNMTLQEWLDRWATIAAISTQSALQETHLNNPNC